ncbi:MAG: hypothetical protein ACXWQX_18595 [Bdellovibrio sp.]
MIIKKLHIFSFIEFFQPRLLEIGVPFNSIAEFSQLREFISTPELTVEGIDSKITPFYE